MVEKKVKSTAKTAPAEPGSSPPIGEGALVPSFELANEDGDLVSSRGLRGAPYVLYFYPRDNTPGCTTEACDFRDQGPEFEDLGIRVIGVSPDSVKSHRGFVDKHELGFTLLADPSRQLAQAMGVYKMKKLYGKESLGIERSTFLVGEDGRIKKAWRGVKVAGHVEAVLLAARE